MKTLKNILSFTAVTVLLIFLFIGTCVPLGAMDNFGAGLVMLYTFGFGILCFLGASKTENKSIKAALITSGIAVFLTSTIFMALLG